MFDGPFRGSTALADGLISPGVLRGPRYQRLLPDVYAAADLEPDLALRSRAAFVWLGGKGVLGGQSAAEIYAARCAPPDAAVEIVVPGRHLRGPPGVSVRRDLLAADEHRRYGGVEVTTPVRTAYDLARRGDLTEGVVSLDALAGRFGFAPCHARRLSTVSWITVDASLPTSISPTRAAGSRSSTRERNTSNGSARSVTSDAVPG